MELFLIRHGETPYNRQKRYTGKSEQPLNRFGRQQIRLLRKKLRTCSPDIIYASDLLRCRQTVELLQPGCPVIYTAQLQEIDYGILEGLTYREFTTQYPEEQQKWCRAGLEYRFPGGQSYPDLYKRVVAFFRENGLEQHPGCVMVVTHGGCICALLSHYLTGNYQNFWKFRIKNGGYARLGFHEQDVYLQL